MNDYYRRMMNLGLEFQDFVIDELYKIGLPLISYSSKKYQIEVGESKAGIEIKYDRNFRKTGNFYIETDEKSREENPEFVRSGIFREDNTWLYIVGDYKSFFVFSKKQLIKLFFSKNPKIIKVETKTSRGFLLPVEYGKRFLVIKEVTPKRRDGRSGSKANSTI